MEVAFSDIPKKVEESEDIKQDEYISVKKDEKENKCVEFSQSLIKIKLNLNMQT